MSLEGKQIERYTLLRLLGSGGMGDVYLAEDPLTGRQVAIKVMHTELSQFPDGRVAHLFQREAESIAKLDHPRILPLYGYGEEHTGNTPVIYMVMPYRPEGSLIDWLRRRDAEDVLTPQDVAFLIGQAADALQHAHDHGIIHRDVKHSNFIIRTSKDTPSRPDMFLSDFGLAALSDNSLTNTAQSVHGTPAYMAPELWDGAPVPATDQYALAVMTYELLTGRLPFQVAPGSAFYQLIKEQPQPPSAINSHLTKVIDAVLLHALEKRPEDRFVSVTAFARVLQQAAQNVHGNRTIHTPVRQEVSRSIASPTAIIEIDKAAQTKPGSLVRPVGTSISSAVQIKPVETPASMTSISVPHDTSNYAASEMTLHDWQSESPHLPAKRNAAFPVPVRTTNRINLNKFKMFRSNAAFRVPIRTTAIKLRSKLGRKPLLVAASILLAVALVGSAFAYTLSIFTRSATVIITPASSDLKSTYTIQAVTKSPDASQDQVSARLLTSKTPVKTQTIKATGMVDNPGLQAAGTLTISNFDRHSSLTLNSGTVIPDDNDSGIQTVLDAAVTVQPARFFGSSSADVAAHIMQIGKIGNVPAYNGGSQGFYHCNNGCTDATDSWSAQNNTPFTGGTDKQKYTFVQQSDIDSAAKSLEQTNTPDPQTEIQPLVRTNERLLGPPRCSPVVTSGHPAGDKVTSATVSVSYNCTGEVYDYDGMRSLAAQMFKNQANTQLGNKYALVGTITTSLTSSALTNTKDGTIILTVNVEGLWVYRFTSTQKQSLVKLIAGRTKSQAQSLLASQAGIARVGITFSGNNNDTLPTDASRISFVINNVSG